MIAVYLVLVVSVIVLVSCKNDIFDLVARQDVKEIESALDSKPELINKKGPGEQTPLMNAVLSGKSEVVKFLLSRNADVSIGEQDGYTPMHGAGFQGRADIAELLIAHGISSWETHEDGFIPFHRACWGKEKRHTDTVKVFLDAGIPYDVKSKDGRTCLDMTENKATKKLIKKYKKSASKTAMNVEEL